MNYRKKVSILKEKEIRIILVIMIEMFHRHHEIYIYKLMDKIKLVTMMDVIVMIEIYKQ
jgi:hypothetical protein